MRDISAVVIIQFQGQSQEPCTSTISVLRQEWTFFSFSLTIVAKRFFSVWQCSWVHLWTVTSFVFFCSMSRVTGWCLLKKITKYASLLYLCIFEKVFENGREDLRRCLFCESCGIIEHSMLTVKLNIYALLEICWRR